MKTTWFGGRVPMVQVAGFLLAAVSLIDGCSDKDTGGGVGPGSSDITVEEIIFNPRALAPGDTLLVTAVVTSTGPNVGDFVSYEWSASGGEFVSQSKSTVRWRSPSDRSGIYSLTVTARNSVSSSSLSDQVFVGRLEPFIAERAGELLTVPASPALYYTSAPGLIDDGLAVRFKDGTLDEAVFPPDHLGTQYSFDANRRREVHTFIENILYTRIIVVYDDLQAKTQKTVARDDRDFAVRFNEFTRPSVSLNGEWICYQGGLLDQSGSPAQGGVDTFAVFVYNVIGETSRRATFKGNSVSDSVSNCFYPTISSDNGHVVFVSDRRSPAVWEYYALPIQAGGVVADTIPDALIELTDTGGKITSGDPMPSVVLRRQWNPNPSNPTLASVGTDNKLRLIHTGERGARPVDIAGEVSDLRWAPSGEFLVASVSDDGQSKIYRIPSVGTDYQVLWSALPGDRISDLSVSPDGELVVYSNKRGQGIWYELIGTNRPADGPPPVRISPAWVAGEATTFGPPHQSLRPAWASAGSVVYLFFLDESTPRVISLDLSGIGG